MAYFPDTRLRVKPIVFYPQRVAHDPKWVGDWLFRVVAARKKYHQILKKRDTFELDPQVLEVDGSLSIPEYLALTHHQGEPVLSRPPGHVQPNGILSIAAEVMQHGFFAAYSRYTLPYCLPILVVDPQKQWTLTGGHNLNGGVNRGCGIAIISSKYDGEQKLQSTLLHELGHAFGLPHSWERIWIKGYAMDVGVYECFYDRWRSPSVMSYNQQNWSNAMEAKDTPGAFIADDIDTLCFNRLAFPALFFDSKVDFTHPNRDVAADCPAHDKVRRLAEDPWDMSVMQPTSLVWFFSHSGSADGTHPQQLNDSTRRYIAGNSAAEPWDQIKQYAWLSKKAAAGSWATLEMTFPIPVTLDRIIVYSGHSGNKHRAEHIQVKVKAANGAFKTVSMAVSAPADATMTFAPATARVWQLRLRAGASGQVAVRGVRHFRGAREWFPPEGPIARTSSGEAFDSQVQNLVAIQRTIQPSLSSVGWDPTTMWRSDSVNELGWVALEVAFPSPTALDKLIVFSGHSGNLHQAKQVQVQVMEPNGAFKLIHQQPVNVDVQIVNFTLRQAQVWKLAFQSALGGSVVIRGLRFFSGLREIFPAQTV